MKLRIIENKYDIKVFELARKGSFNPDDESYYILVKDEYGIKKRIWVQHFSPESPKYNTISSHKLSKADFLVCCKPSVLPKRFRSKHLVPEHTGFVCVGKFNFRGYRREYAVIYKSFINTNYTNEDVISEFNKVVDSIKIKVT